MDWERRIKERIAGGGPEMVVQPIKRLEAFGSDPLGQAGPILGFEALSRFPEDRLPAGASDARVTDERGFGFGPQVWFGHADALGLGVDLELSAVEAALKLIPLLPGTTHLAVNVGPALLVSGRLTAVLDCADLSRVVIELTEHLAIRDYGAIQAAVEALQDHGARVCTKVGRPPGRRVPAFAADDVGAGEASLKHLLRLASLLSFAKMDIWLTTGITTDGNRQDLATAMVSMGRRSGFRIVAEGVEDAEQVHTLRGLGVYAGQGYHLGRPGPP